MEDMAVDPFATSSFGTCMVAFFQGSLTVPSWHSVTSLASGWTWTAGRQTITASLGVRGATSVTHFSRSYAFLGGALSTARYTLWARVLRGGAAVAPPAAVLAIAIDETTMKKSGPPIEGGAYDRNGAGTARQAYRSLWGITLGWAIMRVPFQRWPGHHLSLPSGLELSLKAQRAGTLGVPYRSRSPLARGLVDVAAQHLPDRPLRVVADGASATKAFVRHLPKRVQVICRLFRTATLSQVPLTPAQKRRGAPPEQRGPARFSHDPGPATSRVAPSPPGSGGLGASMGWAVAPGLARAAHPPGGGETSVPCGPPRAPRHKALWSSQTA
jgi:hypothetical protein